MAAQSIEDFQSTIDLVLHGIIRSLRPFGELVRPLEVHRQLVLDGSDSPLRPTAESFSHLSVLPFGSYKTRASYRRGWAGSNPRPNF
jgi:hypothetical protein